ncbi:hypothetical protein Bca52824_036316 [Brassica carinata]|uniref:tRNA-intron lyase n=1 Tax=Brassica carinata TaxID=52824 RepID=A0A8X7S958_BRACI|nr:hypothetical protein Bca52824_036316 [Brassica carinata]
MAPRWKWKGAEVKALAEPVSYSVSELQLSLAKTETSGSLSSCNVLLAVEPEQAELLDRCCFGRLVISSEKVKKWIQLSFEEAFYLLYNLKCIKIYLQGRCLENEVDTWMYMKSKRPNFPIFFKAYSHLRSKNWVLRSGLQYGVDFVPLVRVWSDIHCALRLSGSVAKTLLTLHSCGNPYKEDLNLPLCLDNYTLEEHTICRWSPELSREDETTNPKPNATTVNVPKKLSSRAGQPLKLAELEPDSSSSPISTNNRTPKDKNPKVSDRKPPRSPLSEEGDLEFGGIPDERSGLAVVVQEIRALKLQIETVTSSEAGHVKQAELRNSEIHLLRENLMDTLFLVESFRNQLNDCEVTDAETKAIATETLNQLENAKKAVEELKSDGTKAVESYRKMAVELEQSKSRMVWLEGLVTKLNSNEMKASSRLSIQAELQSELKTAKSKIDKLKAMLVAKKTELQFISEEKDNLYLLLKKNKKETDAEAELKQLREVIEKLKADLMDKETQLQIVSDENKTLKSDIQKKETDVQDALMKLEIAMKEADKSSQRAVRVTEQLNETQASYSEMKTELMKLNVQSNQWRIAAEEATTMRSARDNNNQTNSPYSEDTDDEEQRREQRISLRRLVFCGRIR